MKILMATSEFAPLASTGDVGDHVRTLALELKRLGHEVSVVIPLYRSVLESRRPIEPTGSEFHVSLGEKKVTTALFETKTAEGIQLFLLRRDEYFDRSGIYSGNGRAYEDNSERFIFFSKGVVELARRLSPSVDVIHCHDWPTALVPVFIKDRRLPFQTVLSLYDLEYQGSFWSFDFALTGLPGSYFGPRGVEFYGRLNFVKSGILFADTVVLPGEIGLQHGLQPEHGAGLHLVLQENSPRTIGIPTGIDYSQTNPPFDKLLPRRSKFETTSGKSACRQHLLNQLNLESNGTELVATCQVQPDDGPGLSQLVPLFDRLLTGKTRLIVAGSLPAAFTPQIIVAERKYPSRFAYDRQGDPRIRNLSLAGSDIVLLPGSLGTNGITAITALRYGTVPVVSYRNGLRQIITDFDPVRKQGRGFVYYRKHPEGLWDGVQRVYWTRERKEYWDALVELCTTADFSWTESAKAFAELYSGLLRHRRAVSA
jgi:starch synthase